MTLEVIGSGFGRTGTASLKRALEQLGFGKCHHMEEVLFNPPQVPGWVAYFSGQPVDWNRLLDGYRSQVDWPGAQAWRELAAAFPAAKVIHSVRPAEKWWDSFAETIGTLLSRRHDLPAPPHVATMMNAITPHLEAHAFGCAITDRAGALAAFDRRTAEVRAAIPADRLLVFDVAEGWGPLCAFLKVPVPDMPFPRINSREEFWQAIAGKPLDGAVQLH